jgi:hypothetical protein
VRLETKLILANQLVIMRALGALMLMADGIKHQEGELRGLNDAIVATVELLKTTSRHRPDSVQEPVNQG